jgi:hypothetical protein
MSSTPVFFGDGSTPRRTDTKWEIMQKVSFGAQAFAPTSIPNLLSWLTAGSLVLNDGDDVVTWPDGSGNGNGLGGPSLPPKFRTGVLNGLPVVRFNGTSQFLNFPVNAFVGFTAAEAFIVVKANNPDPPVSSVGTGLWDFGTDITSTHYPFTDGIIYDDFGTSARKTTVNPTPSLNAFNLYNVISSSGLWASRLNGGSTIFSTGTNTVAFIAQCTLGSSGGGTVYFNGDIAEFILYNRVISQSERDQIESYVAAKYGLTIA